jgi:branched-chain amino acid transport system ATP-binding protein
MTIPIVEQRLAITDRVYMLQTGRVVMSGAAGALLADDGVRRAYLGL